MIKPTLLITAITLVCIFNANAQLLKKLGKAASDAAERTVERKVEEKTEEKTAQAMDSLFEAPSKVAQKEKKKGGKDSGMDDYSGNNGYESGPSASDDYGSQMAIETQMDPDLNFTGSVIFEDDFSTTRKGDFPSKFTSSAGGEVVSLDGANGLKFFPNSNVLLSLDNLPENFAMEFDLTLQNVPPSLYNTYFNVYFQELKVLKHNDPKNKFGAFGFSLWGDAREHQIDIFNKKAAFEIKEEIPYDVNGNIIDNTAKFVALVHKSRLRLFINGEKIADSPSLLEGVKPISINFRLNGTDKAKSHSFIISNVRVTAVEKDLRTQLIEEGSFTSNNILFASGSDQLQPASYDLLNNIGKILETTDSKFMIIGHTDSDGDDVKNMTLSKARAFSVKNYLIDNFNISGERLMPQGRGENEPVAENATEEGKAQNRRVEFQKL